MASGGGYLVECVQDHILDIRDLIDEPEEGQSEWTDTRITKHTNKEMRRIGMMITKRSQDYFGMDLVIPLVTNQYEYEVPMGAIRVVYIYSTGITDNGNDVYTVSPDGQHYEVDPTYVNAEEDELDEGYYNWGTKLTITKGIGDVLTGKYLVIKLIRSLPDLMYGTIESATANTVVIRNSGITNGTMEYQSNTYIGFGFKIYNGTGAGQERRIIGDSFDGTDHTLTLNSDWGTTPTGTVYFSLTPPFPQEFEDPLVFGAAMRCKIRVEDEQSDVKDQYTGAIQMALDLITPRNKAGTRRLRRRYSVDGATKRIIVRRN